MATSTLQFPRLARLKLAALRRRAKRDGLTPEQYVKRLIEDDLKADAARNSTFDEVSKPFREALQGISEEEFNALVDKARGPRHPKRARESSVN